MKLKQLHYGWVVVVISTGILATFALLIYTFGIFVIPVTTEFGWDRGALSAALSITTLVSGAFAIVAGRLSDKYGPRILVTFSGLAMGTGLLLMSRISSLWQVYLIWGVFVGIGAACCSLPIFSTIPRWFTKKTGIAVGLAVTGSGIGGIISPSLAQWLISSYGWRQAYVVLGLVTFIIIPLAQFMKHSPERIGLKPYGEDGTIEDKQSLTSAEGGLSFTQAIKTGGFWIFSLILFCFFFALQVIVVHVAPYAVDVGISPVVAASIVSIFAGTSILGRLAIGFISDRVGGRLVLSACVILVTLALIWLLFTDETWMFYVFAVVFGVAYGGIIPLVTVVTAELFGVKSLGVIEATILLCSLIGGVVGMPLAGYIFDASGSYSLAFIICVIMGALAIILSLILLRYKIRQAGVVSD